MSLKVIGGTYRSRTLKSVRGLGTRPLLARVREAVFNILADRIPGALVWDLFAGTGANGIEAMSRGADRVAFVEKNNRALSVLRENLRTLGPEAEERSAVLRADAWDPPVMHRSLFGGARRREAAEDSDQPPDAELAPDIVFLDPPYAAVEEDPVKSVYRARQLALRLAPGGCVVFHFPDGRLEEDDFDPELDVELRSYGASALAFLHASDRMVGATSRSTADEA